tara:strand:- start:161 stop:499 length:339 start_codon:yes stop_codon:yes gene_type:complete
MALGTDGDNVKLRSKDFRSISPNEYIEENTLVWVQRNDHFNEEIVEGPFVIESGWGPLWFGSPNENKPKSKSGVKLISTVSNDEEIVTWRSFLFTTYYVINEGKLCIDVEMK